MLRMRLFWKYSGVTMVIMVVAGFMTLLIWWGLQSFDYEDELSARDFVFALAAQPDSMEKDRSWSEAVEIRGTFDLVSPPLSDLKKTNPDWYEIQMDRYLKFTESQKAVAVDTAQINKKFRLVSLLPVTKLTTQKPDEFQKYLDSLERATNDSLIGWRILENYVAFGRIGLRAGPNNALIACSRLNVLVKRDSSLTLSLFVHYFRLWDFGVLFSEENSGKLEDVLHEQVQRPCMRASKFAALLQKKPSKSDAYEEYYFKAFAKYPNVIESALAGTMKSSDLPTLTKPTYFGNKKLFWPIWYFAFIFITLLYYFAECDYYGERPYDRNEWFRPLYYLHLIFWLPALVLFYGIWGIQVIFFTDYLLKRRRARALAAQQAQARAADPQVQPNQAPCCPPMVTRIRFAPEPSQMASVSNASVHTAENTKKKTASRIKKENDPVWYFVDYARLTERISEGAYKDLLSQGIDIAQDIEITSPRAAKGITFPAEHWQKVFNTLGVKPVNVKKQPTNFRNVECFDYEDPNAFLAKKRADFLKNREIYLKEFIAACRIGLDWEMNQKQSTISSLESSITDLGNQIFSATTKREALAREVEQLRQSTLDGQLSEQHLDETFNQICSLMHVVSVEVRNEKIIVTTDALTCKWKTKTYLFGEFEITIDTSSSNVVWKNIFRRAEGKLDTPYGTCLGNIAGSVAQLCAKRDYVNLVHVLIQFLQTTHNEYSANLRYWEVIDEEKTA